MNKTKALPRWDSGGARQCRGEGEIRIVKNVIGEDHMERMTFEHRLGGSTTHRCRGKGTSGRAKGLGVRARWSIAEEQIGEGVRPGERVKA